MKLKTLLVTLTLASSLNVFAQESTDHEEWHQSAHDLVSSVIDELDLDKMHPDKKPNNIAIAIEVTPPKKAGPSFMDLDPFIFGSIGGGNLNGVNVGLGLQNHYVALDASAGLGWVNSENVINPGLYNGFTVFSAAARYKVTSFLEVGLRAQHSFTSMKTGPNGAGQGDYDNIRPEYYQSLRTLGYDVRVNALTTKNGAYTIYLNLAGLQKNTLAPNYVQVGFVMHILNAPKPIAYGRR